MSTFLYAFETPFFPIFMSSLAGLVNYSDEEDSSSVDEQVQKPIQKPNPPPASSTQPPSQQPIQQISEATALKNRLLTALTPKPIEGIENWGIPEEPKGQCDPERSAKIAHFLSLKASGHRLNDHLAHNKAFRNPRIYAKLVEFIEVDEIGSNFDPADFDPHGFNKSFYIDGILDTQRRLAEEKSKRTSVQFVKSEMTQEQSEAMAKAMANAAKVASKIAGEKRKGKWDSDEGSSSSSSNKPRH
ncbi:hypothetical protein RMATCC62417_10767 [Rhizopus microsporus]|nr:hypothetical protein RMATCC62417_10767 [Rhizopus microsporus]